MQNMRFLFEGVQVTIRQTTGLETWRDSQQRPHLLQAGTFMVKYPDGIEVPLTPEQLDKFEPLTEKETT